MSSLPRTIKYALAIPSLICSLIVIISMGYLSSSNFQDRIYTDGIGGVGPAADLVVGGLETLYLIIAISLTFANIVVPTLAGILVDSLFLIHVTSSESSFLVSLSTGIISGRRLELLLSGPIPQDKCRTLWHTLGALQLLAMVLQFLACASL
ncbi:hypothetical protein B0H14DRAFT_3523675 [Mycena olivaceomarginata]|nr:hypothetical protein B0H14DRAFT_3523675 [Mycena olivaceomarginata]